MLKIKEAKIFVAPTEYKIDGKTYYRVTSTLGVIAKHRLRQWMGRTGYKKANKILETRQVLGTHVHKLIELNLKGTPANLGSYEKEIQDGLIEFDNFKVEAALEPEALEQSLWSNKYKYAGTPDYIGYYKSPINYLASTTINHKRVKKPLFKNKSFVIGDWKTGKDIYPTYWLQLAAYVQALEELTGVKVDGAFVARIHDGKIQVKEKSYEELMKIFKAYLAVIEVYEYKYKLGKYAFLRSK